MPAFKAKLHLSTDAEVTASDFGFVSFSVASLAPCATRVVPVSLVVPTTSAAGKYYVGARVDIDHIALEHSDENNANPFLSPGRGNVAVTVE